MTKAELEILYKLFGQAHYQIGYDLKTDDGEISRDGLFECIMDSGHLEDLSRTNAEIDAVQKFQSLSWERREKYIEAILPFKYYECGIEGQDVL